MSKSTFTTQPILAISWIEPCNLVVPVLTIKKKKKKSINICMKIVKEIKIMI